VAWYKNHWKAREGRAISASGLAEIAKTCDWISKLRVAAPLGLTNIGGGPLLSVAPLQLAGNLAVTSSAISACVYNSGSCTGTSPMKWAPGGGTVYSVSYNGACLVANLDDEYDVINFSTTTGGIPTDTLVWTQPDSDDNWYITAVDCGN
jgi:hypothetical protein